MIDKEMNFGGRTDQAIEWLIRAAIHTSHWYVAFDI